VFEGQFKCGKYHGQGKHTWWDGDVFEGEWRNGNTLVSGKYTYRGKSKSQEALEGTSTLNGMLYGGIVIDDELKVVKKIYYYHSGLDVEVPDYWKGILENVGRESHLNWLKRASRTARQSYWRESYRLGVKYDGATKIQALIRGVLARVAATKKGKKNRIHLEIEEIN
jgi:hypothetical protein